MNSLEKLEAHSIYVIREAYKEIENLGVLWSMGKDSSVLLHLIQKAFFGHTPIQLIHIDTSYKLPGMIEYRNKIAREQNLQLIVATNQDSIDKKQTYPRGNLSRTDCCKALKSDMLHKLITNTGCRYIYNNTKDILEVDESGRVFDGLLLGIRSDEDGSRAKERVFSIRGNDNTWDIFIQPPEIWNHYNTKITGNSHLRVHPLLDWTEKDIWAYIYKEDIQVLDLYFDKGTGTRYRSLGCQPCTKPIQSTAKDVQAVIEELNIISSDERDGREQDAESGNLEKLRTRGYM